MKIIKWLMSAIGLLLGLVILAIVIFALTFDANEYKQELSAVVKQHTGRELTFSGDIGLSLYPRLGMKLGAMSLSNAAGFGEQPMFQVEEVSVSVDFLSLLKLQPEIDQLVLDGLALNLHKNAQGLTNFDDLVKQPADSAGQPAATEPTAPSSAEPAGGGIPSIAGSFAGLNIQRASLVWRDDSSGDEYRVKDLRLVTGRIAPDNEFPLSLSFAASNKQALNATLDLEAVVGLIMGRLSVKNLKIESNAGGSMLPVQKAALHINGNFDYQLDGGQLTGKGFALKLDSQGGTMQKVAATVAGEIGFNLNSQQLDVAVLDVAVDAEDASLPRGKIKAGLSAASLLLRIPANSVKLDDLELRIDDYRFKGFVHANDFTRPDVAFRLHSARLDVDDLMGLPKERPQPPAEEEQKAPAPTEPGPDVQIALPMDLLRKLRLEGQLGIDELKVQYLTLSKLDLSVKARDGVLDIKPIEIDLYDGHNSSALQVDARGQKPAYKVMNKLQGFHIGHFLKDFMGKDPISGRSDLAIDLTTSGEWLSELKVGLNGSLNVAISDGALTGFNLRHKLDSARAKLRREAEPELIERKTDFSALTLSGQVKNGVFSSQDLNLHAPLIRVGGRGSVDLVKETLDYLVDAKVVTTSKGQDGGEADELSGLPVPVAITGPWLQPKIDVQYDELIKARLDAQKAKLKQKLDAEKEQAAARLAEEKAQLQQKLADEKARLEAEKQQKLDAEKARLEAQKQQALAEEKARLDAQKQEAEQKAKDKLQDKLKKLF
jgi:AsmA protein